MNRRRPVEIVTDDPGLEQALAVVRTVTTMLGASFVAALAVSMTTLASSAAGWVIVAAAAVTGTYPVLWHARRARRPGRLHLGRLPAEAAELVTDGGRQAERLRALAELSPPGPVADHFTELADTADRYVVALHTTLAQASVSTPDRELAAEAGRLVGQLTELADAADELREAQRRHLETSPLVELTEATHRLTAAITADELDGLGSSRPGRA